MYLNKWFIGIVVLLVGLGFLSINHSSSHIVTIDSKKVFEKFSMTGELNNVGKKQYGNLQVKVDSLYKQFENSTVAEKNANYQMFIQEKQKLDEFSNYFAAEQSEQIWNRISAYSKDFASEHDYEIILGAQPNKNVVYTDSKLDVTDEFLHYINQRYEGKE